MVLVGEIHTYDRDEDRMTVEELIYILEQMEPERLVKVHVNHKGMACSWDRDFGVVIQDDGEDSVYIYVQIESEE